jgi:hypothetical protein
LGDFLEQFFRKKWRGQGTKKPTKLVGLKIIQNELGGL